MAVSIKYWHAYCEGKPKLVKRSENSVSSNRVLKFLFDPEYKYITATVQASMKDKSYQIEIQLQGDSGVCYTSCQCPLQMYKCHHVAAAILFGYKNVAKTDVKCTWLKKPKSLPPKDIQPLSDYYPSPFPEYRALPKKFGEEDRQNLFKRLYGLGYFLALTWMLMPEPTPAPLPFPVIEDILLSQEYLSAENKMTWLRRHLLVDPSTVIDVAKTTIGQRINPLWAAVRKLRFTASNFGQILRAVGKNRLNVSLKKRLLSSYNLEKIAAIQWGVNHESAAIQQYCELGGIVADTGFYLHESGVLGASPDGLVTRGPSTFIHCEDKQTAAKVPQLLEVKCLYASRDLLIKDAVKSVKDFYLVMDGSGILQLRKDHDYWHQIQGQLHISGFNICDFVVWTSKDIEVIRIAKDSKWTPNLNKMIDFYYAKFIPSLD